MGPRWPSSASRSEATQEEAPPASSRSVAQKPKPEAEAEAEPAAAAGSAAAGPAAPEAGPAHGRDPPAWVSRPARRPPRERLFLNRFGTGFTQNVAGQQLRAAGSPEAWLERPAEPRPSVTEAAEGRPTSTAGSASCGARRHEKYATDRAKTKAAWEYGHDLGNWSILRRIYSERTVLETMTDFWSTNLHIPVGHDRAWVFRFDYDETIRENALGTLRGPAHRAARCTRRCGSTSTTGSR